MDVDLGAIVQGSTAKSHAYQTKEFRCLSVKGIDIERRRIEAVASTGALDRDNEIILPSAFKKSLPEYLKNPVVLAGHQHRLTDGRSPVVASCVKAWITKDGLHIIVEFARTSLGEEYWALYRDKHQRAFSVGIEVRGFEDEFRDDKRVRVITEVELYEISCVPVPANPEALSKSAKEKQSFIRQKQEDREIEKCLAGTGKTLAWFEADCDNFAEALLCDDRYVIDERSEATEKGTNRSVASITTKPNTVAGHIQRQFQELLSVLGDEETLQKFLRYRKHPSDGGRRCEPEEIELFDLIIDKGIEHTKKQLSGELVPDFAALVSVK